MYDPSNKRIEISRDLRWIGKFYNDGHPIEIPDYKENNATNVKSIPPPIRYDDTQKENDLMKQPLNEKNSLENPTTNDTAEVVLVGRIDKSYKSPDAWYNENPKLWLKWRETIETEFKNMEKNHLWRVIKKRTYQKIGDYLELSRFLKYRKMKFSKLD